jgi:hypothetical protein
MKSLLHAPRTGPGYSAGTTPPCVTKGRAAHPVASSGRKSGTRRAGGNDTSAPGKRAGGKQPR